jgi:hypothetical protein
MIAERIHPKEPFRILGVSRSVSDQEQPDKIEKISLFGIVDLKSFKPQRYRIEQFLIADPNSNKRGIYGTYVTTHRISARSLAQVEEVCRPDFQRSEGKHVGGERIGVSAYRRVFHLLRHRNYLCRFKK